MPHPLHVVDVFAEARWAGNPLSVVLDAGDLSGDQMQAIAREQNHSETTFVTASAPRDGAWPVRIFTPATELPFAGPGGARLAVGAGGGLGPDLGRGSRRRGGWARRGRPARRASGPDRVRGDLAHRGAGEGARRAAPRAPEPGSGARDRRGRRCSSTPTAPARIRRPAPRHPVWAATCWSIAPSAMAHWTCASSRAPSCSGRRC
ncbi:MAG: PhzF family phenazine biosynthesis protein [Deltaproteobacteria bacterium]|nr:PhzF family phenazine biosynthesis protein [Deltaproteobacteria bacterium]